MGEQGHEWAVVHLGKETVQRKMGSCPLHIMACMLCGNKGGLVVFMVADPKCKLAGEVVVILAAGGGRWGRKLWGRA